MIWQVCEQEKSFRTTDIKALILALLCEKVCMWQLLHRRLHRSQNVSKKKLKSRRPLVSTARKLLDNLSEMSIRTAQWMNTKWNIEYPKSISGIHAFIARVGTRSKGVSLLRASWDKINQLRSGSNRFCSSMHKWGLVSFSNCDCGGTEQTVDHIISQCLTHQGISGLMVFDDETRCWLNTLAVSSWPRQLGDL